MEKALNNLKPGDKGTITKVRGGRRLMDMGLVKGAKLEVVRVAPLGDPIEISIRGYNLTLRKDEAAGVTVEVE
ncbi:MAG: FeoA family protein [Actinomycetota bacterium]|nr:FeoA family protein [Actinomycetota bacterium]